MENTTLSYEKKFLGVLVGGAVGDSIGELAAVHIAKESLQDWLNEGDTLRYTDDTAMSIGLAEAIIQNQSVNEKIIGEKFQKNYAKEPWRSYSPSTPAIFAKVKRYEITYSKAAEQLYDGMGSFGNGAAMRIAPLGALFRNSKKLRELSEVSAKVTHSHPMGIDGACLMSYAVGQLVNLDPKKKFPLNEFIIGLVKFSKTKEIRLKLLNVMELIAANKSPKEAAKELKLSQRVDETIPFAIYSFLKYKDSYKKSLFCSVLNGGDQDTLGAITGNLSGAYLGYESIPQDWASRVENSEYIVSLSKQLNKLDGTI
ncbi:MAG: hypothetical protein CMM49_07725 [Rhodospirillaceae bacterium]|nr:hypothetical protein [Rhodospirillaceae bacterium]|tara:strand:+ start:2418 stop:3356 length:939 start_codon:yes stop_codon:yes gene_type:complete